MAPASFHLIPESCTAITTSGRPVWTRQAMSTLIPVTPKSSCELAFTVASVLQKLVLAYFHLSPLQAPGAPLISFASGMHPGGLPDESQRFGSAGYGNSARAPAAASVQRAMPAAIRYERMRSSLAWR